MLDEPDWIAARDIGEIRQREPRPGEIATERTEVKVLYDDSFLYIGVVCFDSAPDQILGTRMVRDSDLNDDDRIEILVDPYRDRRNAFYFSTNPLGVLVDGLIIENGNLNREWDAIWLVRTHRSNQGWTAEFSIPFKSLSFRVGQETWGFNFSRTIKRKIEEDRWTSFRLDTKFLQVSEAGEIAGLSKATQGRGLDVRPFVSGRWLHDAEPRHHTVTGKPGLDVFYNLTPNLKWTTTINTDFGETEVDARQINLTRFPLFFPEKRSFFLENAGVFNFSNTFSVTGSDAMRLLPFFSRRIGLVDNQGLANNQEVPILFGTKLTGKVGRTDLGVLQIRTKETAAVNAKNFFVGRVKQNLLRQSYIGAIFTQGDPSLPADARTYGADLRLATSRLLGHDRNFSINAFVLKSSNEGVAGDDAAWGLNAEYPNDMLNMSFTLRDVQNNFRPALGFVPRTNVRFLQARFEYDPRPKGFLNIRQMFNEFFFTRYTRLTTGQVESWRIQAAPVNWLFNSGDQIEVNYAPQFERLFVPFPIAAGVVLPPGDYRFTRWRLEALSASKRPLEVRATWWFGTYWSGRANEIHIILNYKLAPHLQMSWDTNQTFARLKEGNFVARTSSLAVNYSLTPFITLSNLVQYDNDSRNLGWQSRFRWILRPGSDLFVIFNQGWQQDLSGDMRFSTGDTKLAAKIQHTFRF